jgi:hypothetical protein
VTLTYNDAHLPQPEYPTLRKDHFQKFMKRLRKAFHPRKIRFYHCGEYGEKYNRPHYHALLFGLDFKDKKLWKMTKQGDPLFTSQTLSDLWSCDCCSPRQPLGFCSLGAVTFKSAAYCARYIMKKQKGESASTHYTLITPDGVVLERLPEYTTMSRRPGIAADWYRKFRNDIYPDDFVVHDNSKYRPHRFYDRQLEADDPMALRRLKGQRTAAGRLHDDNNTPERRKVREKVQLERLNRLPRNLQED